MLVFVLIVVLVLAPVLVVLVLAPVLGCVLMLVLGCANVSACPGHPDLRGCHGVQQGAKPLSSSDQGLFVKIILPK